MHEVGFSLHDYIEIHGQQNIKVHFDVQKNPVIVPYLKQMNSFNIITPCFLHYIILAHMPKSPKRPLLNGLWPLLCQNSHLSQTYYIQDIFLSPSVDNTWRVHLTKLFMHSSTISSIFLALGSKYSPQHPRSQKPAIYVSALDHRPRTTSIQKQI